jgi:hypothetical protein
LRKIDYISRLKLNSRKKKIKWTALWLSHLLFGVAGDGCPAPAPGQERAGVEQLLASLDIDQAAYRLGNTQVTTIRTVT